MEDSGAFKFLWWESNVIDAGTNPGECSSTLVDDSDIGDKLRRCRCVGGGDTILLKSLSCCAV